jgi:hypothetical protein
MEPLAFILATNATRELARSALPDAPVEPPQPPRLIPDKVLRRATAAALHRLADLVEPHVVRTGRPATR